MLHVIVLGGLVYHLIEESKGRQLNVISDLFS